MIRVFLLIFFLSLSNAKLYSQTWLPQTIDDEPLESWLRYIHNAGTHLMLHDSTCRRANNFTGKRNKIGNRNLCIAVYDSAAEGDTYWKSWKVYYGKIENNYFIYTSYVIFDTNREPTTEIIESGKLYEGGEGLYEMVKAAELSVDRIDLSDTFIYEIIVMPYRSGEHSVYMLPEWDGGEEQIFGADFYVMVDTKNYKVLSSMMLHNSALRFIPILVNGQKYTNSENKTSVYPSPTDVLMMYRRKTGPPHISICKDYAYYISENGHISFLEKRPRID